MIKLISYIKWLVALQVIPSGSAWSGGLPVEGFNANCKRWMFLRDGSLDFIDGLYTYIFASYNRSELTKLFGVGPVCKVSWLRAGKLTIL